MSDVWEMALFYAEQFKWPIFPTARSKAPLVKGGCHAATIDIQQIRSWAVEFPDANIALATGKPSGVFVVDVDGPGGQTSWSNLVKFNLGGKEPVGPQVLTGKGKHLYFQTVGDIKNSVGKAANGIDVRGDGGSATLPPSIHSSGAVYEWVDRPDWVKIPIPTPGLMRALDPRPRRSFRRRINYGEPEFSLWQLVNRVRTAPQGSRNQTLNTSAFIARRLMERGTPAGQIIQELTDAALDAGLERHEIRPTILSGLGINGR